MVAAVAASLALIAVGGVGPVWWAARDFAGSVFLILPAGLVVCATAAGLTLLIPGPFLLWWAVVTVVAAASAWRVGRPRGRCGEVPTMRWLPGAAVLAAMVFAVTELRQVDVGWDARSIWLLHARLIGGGHDVLLAGLTNPALRFSNQDYPPAASGAVALAWAVIPGRDYRLAQVVIGVLTAMAAAAFGVELARLGRGHVGTVLSTLTGVLVLLGCYACFGTYGAMGYMDPLWAAMAAGAVVAGLIAPVDEASTRSALLLAAAAGLTKNDGVPIAIVIIALTVVRRRRADGDARWRLARWDRDLVAPLVCLAAVASWPVVARVHGIHNRVDFGSGISQLLSGNFAVGNRFPPMWSAVGGQLPLAWWVGLAAVIGALTWRHDRRQAGLGSQGWTVAVLGVAFASLIVAYLLDPNPIGWLIRTSIDRTTIFLKLLGLTLLAGWPITLARRCPSSTRERGRSGDEAVDIGSGVQRGADPPAVTGEDPGGLVAGRGGRRSGRRR